VNVPSRTPTWDEIEQFCAIDGWTHIRSTDHEFWQKTLVSGEVLETHTSFAAKKTMSQGRFAAILRNQLKVSRREFWNALKTRLPVERPTEEEEPPPTHDAWVVLGLKERGVTEEEIARLNPAEAKKLLHEKWSEPSA